ncbi:MAG: peptidyl-prolyl cis-trans isomerase [Actinomycetota bacterium]
MSQRKDRRVVVALVLAALLVVLLVGVAIAQGIGNPSVPSGDVAVVEEAPDSEITQEEFDSGLAQSAALQGVTKVPPPSDPQYATLRDSAMSDLLLGRWVRGEASERGISFSESEVSTGLDGVIKQDFGGQKEFEKFLKEAHFTLEQARERVELRLLSDELQKRVLDQVAGVSDSEIEDYYNANVASYKQPEARDVRQIVNKDPAKLEQAKALLEEDDSPASWKKVAARFSTEEVTKDVGGLREGLTEGQTEPAIEEQIFSAPKGAFVGPVEGQAGFFLFRVEKITPAETTPVAELSEQIQQQLTQGRQQQIAQDFQQDFLEKWRSRTFCADDYLIDSCDNFTPTLQPTPGAPPVLPAPAVSPGQATVFAGQPIPALPQGPCAFADPSLDPPEVCDWPTAAPATPPGVIGPPGAPVPEGGAPAPTPTP